MAYTSIKQYGPMKIRCIYCGNVGFNINKNILLCPKCGKKSPSTFKKMLKSLRLDEPEAKTRLWKIM